MEDWGRTPDGQPIRLWTLRNAAGATVKITNFGATVVELHVPDRRGRHANVVLGLDRFEDYFATRRGFGVVGRVANLIAGAAFELDGRSYRLAANNGRNHIHGGIKNFAHSAWTPEPGSRSANALSLSYASPDGEEGYPGNLRVKAVYTLTDENDLRIDYEATTDAATPLNLTNHSYFNLAGAGDVLGHHVSIEADRYVVLDEESLPTGEIAHVEGTPLDLRSMVALGDRIDRFARKPSGYDDTYVLKGGGGAPALAARVVEPVSGRMMEVWTTEPGLQFYTANYLDGSLRGHGRTLDRYSGLCLEAQHFPDAVHHPGFPSTILRPGKTFRSTTVYKFR